MEKDLLDDVGALDEAETLLHRTHDALILDGVRGILQADVARAQIAPVIGSNLEADFVARTECHVTLDVVFGVW